MTSPSISSTRRRTPCAAGCCGPKFRVKLRISATRARLHLRADRDVLEALVVAVVFTDHTRHVRARFDADGLVHDAPFRGVVLDLDVADQREILAERMTDETVVGQDATQVRMALEHDPVE